MNKEPLKKPPKYWWRQNQRANRQKPPRQGEQCPNCQADQLDYDGLLRLSCPACGHMAECGAFT